MDENTIKSSIELYNTQLEQVEQAILAAGENDDLVKLRDDLKELIELTTDSLLSLKKGMLLQSLESTSSSYQPSSSHDQSGVDDEYAAFQAALGDHVTTTDDISTNQNTGIEDSANENGSMSTNEKLDETLSGLEGMRCRAPFQQDWGCLVYSNALILSVNPMLDDTETPSVKVMFCNPTHSSMAPCQFYLEDRCKFTEEECRNSHGYTVKLEDLQEYQEPDYSNIKIESKVLGLYENDSLWYKATVIDNFNDEGELHVLFDGYDETATLKLEQILPLDPDIVSSSEESDIEEDYVPLDKSDSEDEDCLPVFLWKPPKTTARLGEWEEHTRGIGSKLMCKMGYIVGQGLGKDGQGKAEPVPIQLIPKGKSLDKIMELKEQAGDQDLFDVMKKTKKKKVKKSGTGSSSLGIRPTKSTDVFDFINKKLRGKKGE
ncbi:hypothetical protein LOTGIDRAFT_170716 [Lottia gigantea]|uniref:Zinc finger CCCH-type with G patch domain-containing protein n=1 Tax=Lottia gigantea TaxID=225164 RepID=V4BAG7_LOTGI|nr:hypothetical protein LOTGIDRAFT_170716 [Lottia gigantea]ESP04471.1 hypothetical protein LOTGIDRAFT_170716 [Lottia gigantea]